MAKSKAPTGLSITRDGTRFTCSWKIGDENYSGGQRFWYRLQVNGSWQSWFELSVGTSDTSKVIEITDLNSAYYPNTDNVLNGLQFGVSGKKTGSDYSTQSSYAIYFSSPNAPTVTSTMTSSNVFKATFSIEADNSSKSIYTKYEWQSLLLHESDINNGSRIDWSDSQDGWQRGNGSTTSYSKSITEDSSVISYGSHTRWFRIRSLGPAGASEWQYTKHVYAEPCKATIIGANATLHQSGFYLDITWKAQNLESRPIDEVAVQYAKAVPIANMLPPANPSWQEAITAMDTADNDSASVNISGGLEDDQCLFARVVTTHDNRNAYSDVILVRKGVLATPSNLTAVVTDNSASIQATNNSTACVYTGSDSSIKRQFLGIIYRSTIRYTSGVMVGVIPTSSNQVTITIPSRADGEEYTLEVQSLVGTYKGKENAEGVTVYTAYVEMVSESVSTEGTSPREPENLTAEVLNGTDVRVSWDWTWDKADGIELSWSQDEDAWQSTNQPTTFNVNGYSLNWLIKGLETGKRYYLKARFKIGNDYSPYSKTVDFIMSTAPVKPIINLSAPIIAKDGSLVVSWNYNPTDGSEQAYAEIVCDGDIICHALTDKHVKIYAEDIGWTEGTYGLTLRVKSSSGMFSDYSDIVYVAVAPELTATIASTSLVNGVLNALPFNITVTGAGTSNLTTVEIVRADNYSIMRPDEELHNGYENELVCVKRQNGESQMSIDLADISGELDDGAKYRIIATVQDSIGQTSKAELDFTVEWSHQASIPSGAVTIDGLTAQITPQYENVSSGDVCDIYRISPDKPELILKGGEFGTTYVDPYPAIKGGYRIVYRTVNGDYITEDNTPAWVDIESNFDYPKAIIDFGTDKVELYYNVDTNHSWSKDFVETKYLGGSIQGDWNSAVSRTGSVSALTLNTFEEDTIRALRRLAEYTGICNVRTLDGSSFHADVQVSESRSHDRYGMISDFSLNITRVDSQGYDAYPLGGQ